MKCSSMSAWLKKEQKKFKILNLYLTTMEKVLLYKERFICVNQINYSIISGNYSLLQSNKFGYNLVPDLQLLLVFFYTCSRLNYMLYSNNVKETLCSISSLITIEKVVSEHQNTDVQMKWSAPRNRWVDMFSHFSVGICLPRRSVREVQELLWYFWLLADMVEIVTKRTVCLSGCY